MHKIILVTGSSRGIGAATAIMAAQRGYKVAVNYRNNEAAARNVVQQIKENGGIAHAFQADVSIELEVQELFQSITNKWGPIQALVNNAGILEQQMRISEMKSDRFRRVLMTNMMSCFLCSREAIRQMSTRTGGVGGAIVNVSSIAAILGAPNEYIDYAASKGAMDTFTVGFAKEVATEGIRVNGVRPGLIYTDIHADGGEPDRVDRLKSGLPMQRGGTAEEVAETILWLLSDAASYCTGTFIDVSGGR